MKTVKYLFILIFKNKQGTSIIARIVKMLTSHDSYPAGPPFCCCRLLEPLKQVPVDILHEENMCLSTRPLHNFKSQKSNMAARLRNGGGP